MGALAWGLTLLPFWIATACISRTYYQNLKDLTHHVYLRGLPGCGKTSLIIKWIIERMAHHAQIFIAIKDVTHVLRYVTEEQIDNVILMQPYGPNPRGFDFFKCYTNLWQEREALAGNLMDLLMKNSTHIGPKMNDLVYFGALAILEYRDRTGTPATFWSYYQLFDDEGYRSQVLSQCRNPLTRSALTEPDENSMDSLLSRLRKLILNGDLICSLCHDDIDLEQAIEQKKLILCDFSKGHMGEAVSSFLSKVVVTKLTFIFQKRQDGKKHPIAFAYLDEFQNYVTDSIASGVYELRSKGLSLHLSHQDARGQLTDTVRKAAMGAGSVYLFRQHIEDETDAKKLFKGEEWQGFDFNGLPDRYYVAKLNINGFYKITQGKTPDLPPVQGHQQTIFDHNSRGKNRDEIVKAVQRVQVVRGKIG